jgi:hypothetical protein
MKLESQVCSLELARKLKELGVKQESMFIYANRGHFDLEYVPKLQVASEPLFGDISAFTVAELGTLLPGCLNGNVLRCHKNELDEATVQWEVGYWDITGDQAESRFGLCTAETEADARALCLIYLLENKLIP